MQNPTFKDLPDFDSLFLPMTEEQALASHDIHEEEAGFVVIEKQQ